MKSILLYNWEVRDEYFKILSSLSLEELQKDRGAGLGSIFKTLVHIIDVEISYIRAISNKPDIEIDVGSIEDLNAIIELSNQLRNEIKEYINDWNNEIDNQLITPSWMTETFSKSEIIRHLLIHEIHHIGQLSIWTRELGITPVSANFIRRDIFNKLKEL